MDGNSTYQHSNVALLAIAETVAPRVVPSAVFDDRLVDTLDALRLPRGLLERVAGVRARRAWDAPGDYLAGAAAAGRAVLAQTGIAPESIGLLINASITREQLEPSVAVRIHDAIGLGTQALNFDIANACLGFLNAMTTAAAMIDTGQIEYALVVAGEDAARIQDATVANLSRDGITREDYLSEFAALTLGSGAVAALLGPADRHPEGHRIVGGIARAATEHWPLCLGDHAQMLTDTRGLLTSGMELITAAWESALAAGWRWEDADRYIMHQVSGIHLDAFARAAGLDHDRIPKTYPELGNIGPASSPITLAREVPLLRRGERVLLMGVGSGINMAIMEIVW